MTGLPFPMYRPLSYRQYTDSIGSVEKYWGGLKHKKQPFSDASASHLPLALWHV